MSQYTVSGNGRSNPNSLPMIAPQAWYYWHTGKIQFWNHVQDYMNGNLGDRPYDAPWTGYPYPNGYGIYGLRLYIFVLQSTRLDATPPPAISDLSVSLSSGQATLQWTGPSTAVRYQAVWSDRPIVENYSLSATVSNWWAANAIGVPGVANPGVRETLSISLPNIRSGNYVAIFSFDQSDNMSQMSNVAAVGGPSAPLPPSAPVPQVAPIPAPKTPPGPLPVPQSPPVAPPIFGNVIHIYQGDNFETTVERLQPGDTVIVHEGDYFNTGRISIAVAGTASLPVVVQGAPNEGRPRILRSSTASIQNTINLEGATYLTLKGLEILSNGGDGIKIGPGVRGNSLITLEDLVIHDVAVGINAQSNVDRLSVRRCHIYDTSGTGEGMYLGCHDGSCIVTNSLIEFNWVHDTLSADQGDGIELKKNSFGNIIRNNVVYNTKFPGILLYGSGGGALNVVEGNVMWNCIGGGIQVAADALIQNNLVFNSEYGLISNPHNGVNPKNLKIVHNTILGSATCLNIRLWNGNSDIIFANNAVYCTTDTMDLQGGTQNVQLAGNVFFPGAAAFPSGSYVLGRSFAQDFGSGTFNAYPTNDSPLRTTGDSRYAIAADFDGTIRSTPADVGAYEWSTSGRKWTVQAGFKPPSNGTPSTPSPQGVPVSRPSPQSPPVSQPTPAPFQPISLPPGRRRICFSDHNVVQVLRPSDDAHATRDSPAILRQVPMSDLTIGDYVPTGKENSYTQVISFCHRDPQANATFIVMHQFPKHAGEPNVTSTAAYPPLEMSADHLVLVRRSSPKEVATWMRAADVQVGDALIGASDKPYVVTRIEAIERTGVFAPITESGTLLVSGAVVSSYVAVLQTKQSSVLLFPLDWQHFMGHAILTPLRLLCRMDFAKYCQGERYDAEGFTWYSKVILRSVDWIGGGENVFWTMVRWLATVGITLPFALLYGMECLLFGNGVVGMEKTGRGGEWSDGGRGWMTAAVTIVLTVYIFRRRSQSVK
jgi:parallel beta-helix repeat protein